MRRWHWVLLGCTFTGLIGAGLALVGGDRPGLLVRLDEREYRISSNEPQALREALQIRAARRDASQVYLRTDRDVIELPFAELGYELDLPAAERMLTARIAQAKLEDRAHLAAHVERLLFQRPLEVELDVPVAFYPERAQRTLQRLKAEVDRAPQDARLLIAEHRVVRSSWGAELSVGATLVRLERAEVGRGAIIDAVVEPLRPEVTEDELLPVDVTRVLASFETSFRGKAGAREVNIRRAAQYLDGAVILPGEVLSFNHRVGRRIHGRGFIDAPVIVNDELEQDVGGGVCQVATALHGAAVYGNLTIVRRRSHSRPSGYAPIGLDATVIDGKVDLEIRNPYDEPLYVHAFFPTRYLLRVELLGRHPHVRVEHAAVVRSKEDFARRVWFKPSLAPGSFDKKQKGSPGMEVVSVLRIKHEDGKVEKRTYASKYYPVPEVFYAGPGTDLASLPALPDGATGLVIDGEDMGDPNSPAGEQAPPPVPTMDQADGLGRDRG